MVAKPVYINLLLSSSFKTQQVYLYRFQANISVSVNSFGFRQISNLTYIGFRQLYRFQANCRKPKDLPETETLPETEKLPETESIPKGQA